MGAVHNPPPPPLYTPVNYSIIFPSLHKPTYSETRKTVELEDEL